MRSKIEIINEYKDIVPLLPETEQAQIIRLVVDYWKDRPTTIKGGTYGYVPSEKTRLCGYELGIAEAKRRLAVNACMSGAEEYEEILASQDLMEGM